MDGKPANSSAAEKVKSTASGEMRRALAVAEMSPTPHVDHVVLFQATVISAVCSSDCFRSRRHCLQLTQPAVVADRAASRQADHFIELDLEPTITRNC